MLIAHLVEGDAHSAQALEILDTEEGLMKLLDCCVLAAAMRAGATLATFDGRLADVARGMGVHVVGAA